MALPFRAKRAGCEWRFAHRGHLGPRAREGIKTIPAFEMTATPQPTGHLRFAIDDPRTAEERSPDKAVDIIPKIASTFFYGE